ncbi:MAG: asparaginase [Hyphomicrobiaceae bacterium]
MANPVLIEVTRGPLVESFHTGSLALVRPDGEIVLAMGDVTSDVFPRSAIKALQAIPLVESGAADAFGYGAPEIALACASHTGTQRHVDLAGDMLKALELDTNALGCGIHPPLAMPAAKALWTSGGEATQLHNNCSGKHAGMLATAKHFGDSLDEYWLPSHPVQQRVHDTLSELCDRELGNNVMGFDGCSVPNWAMPLQVMAQIFAKVTTGRGMSGRRRDAVNRICHACWAEPELVAGPGRADSVIMRAVPGRVFMKTGAEGVYCGALPEAELGFALKIDDGLTRASAGAAIALIETLLPDARGLMKRRTIKSWRGIEVGEIRTGPDLADALAKLACQ